MTELYQITTTWLAEHSIHLGQALLLLLLGWTIAAATRYGVRRFFLHLNIDPTLGVFAAYILFWLILAAFVISALSLLGISTASFIAVLSAVGLALVLGLQKTLANLVTGLMLVAFRPFKIGDHIKAAGVEGTVKEVRAFNTRITTPGGSEEVIIPNGKIMDGNISIFKDK